MIRPSTQQQHGCGVGQHEGISQFTGREGPRLAVVQVHHAQLAAPISSGNA